MLVMRYDAYYRSPKQAPVLWYLMLWYLMVFVDCKVILQRVLSNLPTELYTQLSSIGLA